MIDAYLRSESDIDDHAIHLLFSANRWELAYVSKLQAHLHLPHMLFMSICVRIALFDFALIHISYPFVPPFKLIDRTGRP